LRRSIPLIITLGLAFAITACQSPTPTLSFVGTSTFESVSYDLTLDLQRVGDRLVGEYYVETARGDFDGTVVGTAVVAELAPSSTCSYSFEGTLTQTRLNGTFEPADCPGGQTGTWELERR